MKKIVIASACRTAIGKFGGTLSNVPAAELGSIVIKEAINRAGIKPEQVDHVYMGCVIQAGLGQNVARQASLKAGLPVTTPAVTVNVVCGSGLNCVNMAAQMIEAGDADIVVAGGTENMDMAPFAMMKGRYGYRMGYPHGQERTGGHHGQRCAVGRFQQLPHGHHRRERGRAVAPDPRAAG